MTTALQSAIPSVPTTQEWDALRNFAAMLSRSSLIPEHYRGKPENIMWAAQMARAYGVELAYYMESTYPLPGGKNGHYVKFKQAMATRACPDFEYVIIQNDDEACILEGWRGKRGDASRVRTSFTMEQARRIRQGSKALADKDTYRDYGPDMLFNRAMSRLVDRVCPDAGMRMRAPEVVTGFEGEDALEAPEKPQSGAVVVEDGAGNSGAAPAAPVPVPTQTTTATTTVYVPTGQRLAVEKQSVPVDWRGPLLAAFATCYGLDVPGENTKVRGAFVKKHEEKLVLVANEFYKSRGEQPVTKWIAVGPMDYEHLTRWLEEKNAKRAGKGAAASGEPAPTEGETQRATSPEPTVFDNWEPAAAEPSSAAPVAPGAPEDDEAPAGAEIVTGWQALVAAGPENLTTILLAMRHATKNERAFVSVSSKSGQYSVIDGDLLKTCGFVNAEGTPVSQWLHKLHAGSVWDGARFSAPSDAVWPMFVRAVYEEAQVLKVNTQ